MTLRSSRSEVFLRKGVLKIRSKFTGEHPCRSVISIKLLCNFIEIALRHRCSPVNLLHIFRTPFPRNAFGGLLLDIVKPFCKYLCVLPLIQNTKLQQGKFMWKLNSHNPPNCLLNKISLIRNQAIDNANQQKLIISYYRTTTGNRSVLNQGCQRWKFRWMQN